MSPVHGSLFSYLPLQSPDNEIRLLILEAGEKGSPIRCRLLHANIDSTLPYEALSYTWGSPANTQNILVSGSSFPVRQNLGSALLHLRQVECARTMWIDAICINQQDIEERNQQVTQMRRIYQAAERVVVWLGPSNYTTTSVFGFVAKAPERITLYPAYALVNFCKIEYWQRLWIIQEVLSASNIQIQSGFHCMEWDVLARAFEACRCLNLAMCGTPEYDSLRRKADPKVDAIIQDGVLAQLISQRSNRLTPDQTETLSVLSLLTKYRAAKCEDIRDRVFGLLGLTTACCKAALKVDYATTPAQLQQAILRHEEQNHNLTDEKEYFLAALDISRILVIQTDEETGMLHNLELLYQAQSPTSSPRPKWIRSTLAIVSEPLSHDPKFEISELYRRAWAHYNAKRWDEPGLKEPTFWAGTFEKQYMLANPKESRIPDALREVARKLSYEHLDRLKSDTMCRVFVDEDGRAGVGPDSVRVGDVVCQFIEPLYPLILRREGDSDDYQIIAKSANTDLLSSIPSAEPSASSSDEARSKLKIFDQRGWLINFYMDKTMLRYSQGLVDPDLDFKRCLGISGLGRVLTAAEQHEGDSL